MSTILQGFRPGSKASALAPAITPEGIGRWHVIEPVGDRKKFERSIRQAACRRGVLVQLYKRGDTYLLRARPADGVYTAQALTGMDRSTMDSILLDFGVAPDDTYDDEDVRGLILAMSERKRTTDGEADET